MHDAGHGTNEWRWALLVAALGVLALYIGWNGFIASDDSLYFVGAREWLSHAFPGDTHWSTRFPLILLFAATLRVMGQNFAAFATTAILCYLALVALVGLYARRLAGPRVGWTAAMLTATLPVIVSHATTVSVDLLEAALLIAGALLLGEAEDDAAGLRKGVAAGLCFGLAVLCRETALLSLAGLGPLFLIGKPVPRRVLLAVGVGFAAVIAGELLFQGAMTGEPLRRYTIAYHHDEHIDRPANLEGNFLITPVLDPFLVLLINDDFGMLFWLAGIAVAMGTLARLDPGRRKRLIVLGAMSAACFMLVAVMVHKLVLNPRYFTMPALFAIIVVALWIDQLEARWRIGILAAFVASNLLLLSVENGHPRWTLEAMVDAAERHPAEIVSGNDRDVRKSAIPLGFDHLANTRYAPARPNGLEIVFADQVPPGEIVARYPSPPTRLGALVEALHLEGFVPAPIARRMFTPSPSVVLVRRAQ